MSPIEFCQALSKTPISTALRENAYNYPVLLIIHVLSIALFGGMVALGILRVLGKALRDLPVSRVIGQFRLLKWAGFALLLVTGVLITLSDPVEYYTNPAYWVSLALLLLSGINAWVFNSGIYRSVSSWDTAAIAPPAARRWAFLSLALWVAQVFVGRAIAFF